MHRLDSESLSEASKGRSSESRVNRFTDIHCHCLPALDDGPADVAGSLAVCRALVQDGIAEVVATPHQLGRFDGRCNPQAVREAVGQLNRTLVENHIPLTVRAGADIRLDERIPQLLQSDQVLTLADNGRCLLLELPHDVFVEPAFLLARLHDVGVTAIITHPERHGFLASHPTHVNRWKEYEPCLQITAGSFTGDFGRQCQDAAWVFLTMDLPVAVATDAHDTDSRRPRMSMAYARLCERLGRAAADVLCVENPRRLLAGVEPLTLAQVSEGRVR
jgi:protein-tyrosine phosphatase